MIIWTDVRGQSWDRRVNDSKLGLPLTPGPKLKSMPDSRYKRAMTFLKFDFLYLYFNYTPQSSLQVGDNATGFIH